MSYNLQSIAIELQPNYLKIGLRRFDNDSNEIKLSQRELFNV